jgi:hypothetical protein
MKGPRILLVHLFAIIAKLLEPGGARSVVAEGRLMKQQFLIINHTRRRAPNFSVLDQSLLGFWSLFLIPQRIQRAALILGP